MTATPTSKLTPGIGDLIADRFEILGVLGQGGGGEVYLARQLNVEREVALKLLPANSMNNVDAMRRFEREARLISRLRHPNTITVYEFDRSPEGLLYIAMELVEGQSLQEMLKKEMTFSPRRTVHVVKQILKSLAEAHSFGIVHRDIKPANIMLCDLHGEKDFVKVLDFGVATVLSDSKTVNAHREDVTMTMDVAGTPQYMAPEQFRSKALTPASDLYSLGTLVFEMLTGYTPFSGKTVNDILIKHLFDPIPALPEFLSDYPKLIQLIERSLAKEPEDRYQSAEEMLEALNKWNKDTTRQIPVGMGGRPSLMGLSISIPDKKSDDLLQKDVFTNELDDLMDDGDVQHGESLLAMVMEGKDVGEKSRANLTSISVVSEPVEGEELAQETSKPPLGQAQVAPTYPGGRADQPSIAPVTPPSAGSNKSSSQLTTILAVVALAIAVGILAIVL